MMGNLTTVLFNLFIAAILMLILIKSFSFLFDVLREKIVSLDKSKKKIMYIILSIVVIALPMLISWNPYMLRTTVMIMIYIVLALSLNIVLGFAGQLSIGHSAFYAVGAYTTALLAVNFKLSFWMCFLISGIVAALFGILLGIPTLRLRGDYLAITTIGFGEIIRLVLVNWTEVTRGPAGIPGIPSPSILGFQIKTNIHYYYLILTIVAITILISYRLLNSRLGRGLIALRDDEIAAEAMGVNTVFLKILSFTVGAALAGLAGSFFASFVHYVNPDNFNYLESVVILCMVVLGGVGSIPGVILGAIVLTILPEALRDISTYRYAIYGMLLIAMMIIRPQGMIGVTLDKGADKNAKSFRNKWVNKVVWGTNSSK